ncbi:MAG: hypothetical protein Q8N60_02210, partial [Candidatus Diapherotrites archaeon]|nr:hypothetical protein [Candidatus Diapherotrites archaeon]
MSKSDFDSSILQQDQLELHRIKFRWLLPQSNSVFWKPIWNWLTTLLNKAMQRKKIRCVALFSQACIMPQKTVALIKPFAAAKALGKMLRKNPFHFVKKTLVKNSSQGLLLKAKGVSSSPHAGAHMRVLKLSHCSQQTTFCKAVAGEKIALIALLNAMQLGSQYNYIRWSHLNTFLSGFFRKTAGN